MTNSLKMLLFLLGGAILWLFVIVLIIMLELFGENSKGLMKYISKMKKVNKKGQLIPTIEEHLLNGSFRQISSYEEMSNKSNEYSYSFTVENESEFKVLHMTDLHIFGVLKTLENDMKAFRAVAAMIAYEKPDLVIITGDICFTFEYTKLFNNKVAHKTLIKMMEKLSIYWTVTFGNHESHRLKYTREELAKFYEDNSFIKNNSKYCLFNPGPANIYGYGNSAINLKNKQGKILKSIILMDSNDILGRIHDNQIKWYKNTIDKYTQYNQKLLQLDQPEIISSELFFHIPLYETKIAVNELLKSKGKKTDNAEYLSGDINEKPCIQSHSEMFNVILDKNSTKAIYFGHDHVNTAKIKYKGVIFSYGMTIDYFAYKKIAGYGRMRGNTKIIYQMNTDNSSLTTNITNENYYQDNYKNVEEVPLKREELNDIQIKRKYNYYYPDFLMENKSEIIHEIIYLT